MRVCEREKEQEKNGNVDEPDTDNGFSKDTLSLIKKDFLRMMDFSKVQY